MQVVEPIELRLPSLVSEDWVLENFGAFQLQCRCSDGGDLRLAFEAVTWIDPLAALAIVTELDHSLNHGRIASLQVTLGEWGTSDEALLAGRTRKFLAMMGFFHCLSQLCRPVEVTYMGGADESPRIVPAKNVQQMDALVAELLSARSAPILYDDVVLVPMTLVRRDQTAEAAVDRMVHVANSTYFRGSRLRLAARDSTLQRLRAVLDELVRNALEHGYQDSASENDSAAVFVRVRRPMLRRTSGGEWIRKEERPRPLRGDSQMENADQSERIELYVSDVGRGVLADVDIWRQHAIASRVVGELERTALKNATHEEAQIKLLFRFPVSRFSNPQANAIERLLRGQTTGLVYLDKVLGYPGDVSCLYTGGVRVFGRHRFAESGGSRHERRLGDEGAAITGTLYRVSLRIHNPMEMPPGWFVPEKNPVTCKELALAIAKRSIGPGVEPEIVDLRARHLDLTREAPVPTLFSEREILVRLSRSAGKNELMNVVKGWLTTAGASRAGAGGRLLAVTDMSRSQARNLQMALLGPFDFDDPGLPSIEAAPSSRRQGTLLGTIMMVTEDLAVAFFEVRRTPRGRGPYALIQYSVAQMDARDALPSLRERFRTRLVRLLETLTRDDSAAFWRLVVDKTANGQALLLGPVKWWTVGSEYLTLPVYLDFRAALQERELARTVRKALRRVLSLFPDGKFVAMDKLVEGELRDAMRWSKSEAVFDSDSTKADLLEQVLHDKRLVLVGSVGVSGVTRDRFVKGSQAERPISVECFYRQSEREVVGQQLSALHWIEETGIDYQASLQRPDGVTYERERDTPFVRRLTSTHSTVASVVSFAQFGAEPRKQWPSEMYAAFERDSLLRMGHWQFGGRHSLLEANTPLAVDHFVASGRGFFPWLMATVTRSCEDTRSAWVVVYPAHRSVDKIVRVLRADLENAALGALPSFLPLQIISGIAGGINRISDQSLARLEAIRSRHASDHPLSAIFVDVGFIDKRTLREVRRQLRALGVPVVQALAVNNRSNSPAFPSEDDDRAVQGYWRWNVPILGHPDQCPLCNGLRSLEYLAQAVQAHRRELMRTVTTVLSRWKSASLQDDWWEEGVEPYRLPRPIELRMGYTEDQVFSRHPHFRHRPSSSGVLWHFVKHEYSVGLLAHYIEVARYTGNGTLLLEKVRDKAELVELPPLCLIECLAGYLVVCGQSLLQWQRVGYVEELVRQLFRHQQAAPKRLALGAPESAERISDVLGLATLVALNLDNRTKAACRDAVHGAIKAYLEHPSLDGGNGAMGPEARLFLVALRDHAAERTWPLLPVASTPDLFEDGLLAKRMTEIFDSISLVSRTRRSLWAAFDHRLGSRDEHDGQVLRSLRSSEFARNGRDAASACYALAALLGGATPSFLRALDLEGGWTDILIDSVSAVGDELMHASGADLVDAVRRAASHVNSVRERYQSKLLRCAESEDNVATTLERWFRSSGALVSGDDPFLSTPQQIAFMRVGAKWAGGTHYLPMCRHLQEQITDTIRNAIRNAVGVFDQPESQGGLTALVWIDARQTDRGLSLTILNHAASGKPMITPDVPAPCLDEIGGKIVRTVRDVGGGQLYEVLIEIPWLETVVREELEVAA